MSSMSKGIKIIRSGIPQVPNVKTQATDTKIKTVN